MNKEFINELQKNTIESFEKQYEKGLEMLEKRLKDESDKGCFSLSINYEDEELEMIADDENLIIYLESMGFNVQTEYDYLTISWSC